MSAIDDFNKVKMQRDRFAKAKWCASHPRVRLFDPNAEPTREQPVSDEDMLLIADAIGLTENEGGSDISYCGTYNIGSAVQLVVLYFLDRKLRALAIKAKGEAETILKTLP